MRKPLKPLAYSRPPLNVFGRQLYNGVVNLKYLDENKDEVEVNVTVKTEFMFLKSLPIVTITMAPFPDEP